MFGVILAHIEQGRNSIKVISKHPSREEAVEEFIKRVPSYYGWDSSEDFEEEYPDAFDEIRENGCLENRAEMDDWTDFWQIVEI